MKKLAKFMALVMCISTLGTLNITSANAQVLTSDSMQVNTVDFSDKTESSGWFAGTGIFDTTTTGPAIGCIGGQTGYAYKKIDDEHGLSLAISGGSAISYVFNRTFDSAGTAVNNPVTGRIHFSFDLYAVRGDNTSQALLQFNTYDCNNAWSNNLVISEFRPKDNTCKLYQNGYGVTKTESFSDGMWYRIDLNIDAKEDSAIADVYVNGKYQSTTKMSQALSRLWLSAYNIGVGSSNRMVVDNIRVQTETTFDHENYVDFNEKDPSANLWTGETYSPADATGGVFVRNSDDGASYQAIDNEHGTSYAMAGSAAFKYIFNRTFDENNAAVENAAIGKFKLNFDMYNKLNGTNRGRVLLQLNNSTSYSDAGLIANIRYNESKYCSIKNGSFTWDYSEYQPEAWHNVELIFDAKATSTTVEFYLDNEYVGTKTYNTALKSIGFFPDGSNSSCYTAVDNFEVSAIKDSRALSAAPVEASIKADTESVSVRYSGTLDRAGINDEAEIAVSEYNKDTGLTKEINAKAELDYTATKVNVYFNEKLNENSVITITLPAALKGLFAEDIATETIQVTTKMGMDYSDDFEHYADNASMARFGGRIFTSVEGYLGGKALSGNYTNYPLAESINSNNATTDYIVSFDMKVPATSGDVAFQVVYDSATYKPFRWNGNNIYCDWSTDIADYTADEWHHYDVIFDFDASESGSKRVHLYQDGNKVTTSMSYALWGVLKSISFASDAYVDNFHARYRNEVDVITNLEGAISASTKEGYIKFDDAVNTATLTKSKVYILDENYNEVKYEIKSVNAYGMTIEFADGALKKDKPYVLVIDGVKTVVGEPISGLTDGMRVFDFSTNESFEVTSAKIKNNGVELTSVSAWDSMAEYDVEITLNSTRKEENTIYAIVAGYEQTNNRLVYIKPVEVKVTSSGVYTEKLGAFDITGVDKVKVFVIDGYENLAPLMKQPTQINK